MANNEFDALKDTQEFPVQECKVKPIEVYRFFCRDIPNIVTEPHSQVLHFGLSTSSREGKAHQSWIC
jgi:hypothetical protein